MSYREPQDPEPIGLASFVNWSCLLLLIVGTMIRFGRLYRLKGQLVSSIRTNPSQAVFVGPVQWHQDFAGSSNAWFNHLDAAVFLLIKLVFGVSQVARRVGSFLGFQAAGFGHVFVAGSIGTPAGRTRQPPATANAPGGSRQDGGGGGVRSCGGQWTLGSTAAGRLHGGRAPLVVAVHHEGSKEVLRVVALFVVKSERVIVVHHFVACRVSAHCGTATGVVDKVIKQTSNRGLAVSVGSSGRALVERGYLHHFFCSAKT